MSVGIVSFFRNPVVIAGLVALLLTGCGGTHSQGARALPGITVGVNLSGPLTSPASVVTKADPDVVRLLVPRSLQGSARALFRRGEVVVEESGCLGCHVIGAAGNNGPGPPLTHIGARLTRVQITRALVDPTAPMPSFSGLPRSRLDALTSFLTDLR